MSNYDKNTIAKELIDLTDEIVMECPYRDAGSPDCKKSADLIAEKLKESCDGVVVEKFKFHNGAFLGFFKFTATFTIIGALLFLFAGDIGKIIGAICYTLSMFEALFQFVYYKEYFDFLYKENTGYNVVGTIQPSEEVKQQIIVAGHHDAAKVFTYLVKYQKWYAPRIIGGVLGFCIGAAVTWIWVIWKAIANQPPIQFISIIIYIWVALSIILTGDLWFFMGKQTVFGAGDNMIASVMVLKIAEIFGKAKKNGNPILKHTRLLLHSNDAEEEGIRGARAYVKRHKEELTKIPTYVVNVDSIFDENEIHVLLNDINGTQKLSEEVAEGLRKAGEEVGHKVIKQVMTFGGGATDAAEFAKIGVKATTIIALAMEMIRGDMVYHTMEDTVKNLKPKPIEAVFNILYQYIMNMEKSVQ